MIGLTIFSEGLDEALLCPGRFDNHITVPLPNIGGRNEILEMYTEKMKLIIGVDLTVLSK